MLKRVLPDTQSLTIAAQWLMISSMSGDIHTPKTARAHQDMRETLSVMRVKRGELFHPTVEFYNQLDTNEGLTTAAKDLCRWLGVKPHRLRVEFTDTNTPVHTNGIIEIPIRYAEFPYQAGTLLALCIMEYILSMHSSTPVHHSAVELATIEAGLGILVLNGLHAKPSKHLELYHFLNQNWHIKDAITLQAYSPATYAAELLRYAANLQLSTHSWYRYVRYDVRRFLLRANPALRTHKHGARHIMPAKELSHYNDANRWWGHLVLLSTLTAIMATTFIFVWAQRP